MLRIASLCLIIVFLSGCSTYAVPRYSISVDNVTLLKGLDGKTLNVGDFTSSQPGQNEITCRAAGPIKTPDGETFSDYIRKAFINDLKIANVFLPNAPVTLTGNLNSIDFASMSGTWDISLSIKSSNGKSITISEDYSYASSFDALSACNETAQALMPAVQDLINKIISHPDFHSLIN
jgi:hypothetical protein